MKSIRTNLVRWTAGALAVGLVIVVTITYALMRQQVGSLFDEELRQVALAVHLREDWIEAGRVRIARPGFFLSVRAYDKAGNVYFETALPTLPADLPQSFREGLSRVDTADGPWRIYTHVTEEGIVQIGQPVDTRDELTQDLLLRALMPMLLLIPLLAAIVAWALKRGLVPLEETSRRVSDRDALRLDPLPTDNVPRELLPLITQINALLNRLELSLDSQRRFLADAAHELRSPVAALTLQVQLARNAHTQGARDTALEEVTIGIERARRLVQQLLDFARLDPGVRSEPFSNVELAKLAREVVGAAAARAEDLGVDLGAEAQGTATVVGSESDLRSLIENLVDNALRYSPRESAVTVSVQRQGATVEFSVVDAGPGIPPAERERVFERFYRVAGNTTPGSGLGLAIVRAIVERHHASIELTDANPGASPCGLAARIRFPAP